MQSWIPHGGAMIACSVGEYVSSNVWLRSLISRKRACLQSRLKCQRNNTYHRALLNNNSGFSTLPLSKTLNSFTDNTSFTKGSYPLISSKTPPTIMPPKTQLKNQTQVISDKTSNKRKASPTKDANKRTKTLKKDKLHTNKDTTNTSPPTDKNTVSVNNIIIANETSKILQPKSGAGTPNIDMSTTNPGQTEAADSDSYVTSDKQIDPRIPAIITLGYTTKDLLKELNSIHNISGFLIKNTGAKKCKIIASNKPDFDTIKSHFKENKVNSYSFTPLTEKPQSILLKGLSSDTSTEEIKAALEEITSDNITLTKIDEFNNSSNWSKIFIVQLSPDSDLHELLKIKSLLHQVIKWENLRKKAITQCKNCQRVEHIATNCNMPYRCVKCTHEHEPGQCNIPKNNTDKEKLQCVNCLNFGHPASYLGCPYIQEHLALKVANKNNFTQTSAAKPQARISNNTPSYASVAATSREASSTSHAVALEQTTCIDYTQFLTKDMFLEWSNDLKSTLLAHNEKLQTAISTNSAKIEAIANHLKIEWPKK
uniref:Pre-C2HC domain-containing protein n=1 Tax=Trichogramma kaykai TaxID=54128 RepID=A0ABD2W1T1_9HYME